MPHKPPPFSTLEYWDERFTENSSAFDWLLPPNSLDAPIVQALNSCKGDKPTIMHIGCGTSVLSLHLRAHVEDPQQIHNVDFSRAAIELGARWEQQLSEANDRPQKSSEDTKLPRMRWSVADLLSLPSIIDLSLDGSEKYDVIVEKSTSDAVACGEDVSIPLPYPLRSVWHFDSSFPKRSGLVHPCHILAAHLAFLSKPGATWIAISYSSNRFPFLPPYPSSNEEGRLSQEIVANGFPHPATLWNLVRKEQVEAPDAKANGEHDENFVHRPKVSHWLYVLVRTNEPLELVK
ncbi:hypothetical protein K490DRAFT_49130 [Saccharata proteae CBS 121410]|uniref:Methyltransferase domain-containing protein n=1 Tax=Saccharata proteae CBS 121410 TaxID=1314787 RepID=A0A9P4HPE5_9PEZI|nr:hypothetical protein K490DRAFT_49130 [Saccharata proteae CBS 121410]